MPSAHLRKRSKTFSSKIPNETHTQKEKSIRKQKLSQKDIDNSMKSEDKKCVREKQGGALLSTASGTPISAVAKQINQIPTVLHQVLSLSFSSLISMQKN